VRHLIVVMPAAVSAMVIAAMTALRASLCQNVSVNVHEAYVHLNNTDVLMQARVRFVQATTWSNRSVYVPHALARHLGIVNTDNHDVYVQINTDVFANRQVDPHTQAQVMIHEILHGMGFFSMLAHYVDVTPDTIYTLYDEQLVDYDTQQPLLNAVRQAAQTWGIVNSTHGLYQGKHVRIFNLPVYNPPIANSLSSLSHLLNPDSSISRSIQPGQSVPLRLTNDAVFALKAFGWCSDRTQLRLSDAKSAHVYDNYHCYNHAHEPVPCNDDHAESLALFLFLMVLFCIPCGVFIYVVSYGYYRPRSYTSIKQQQLHQHVKP